jgi:hypothetical protein
MFSIARETECDEPEHDAYVSHVEDGPMRDVNEIHDVAADGAVDHVAKSARDDEREASVGQPPDATV